MHVQRGASFQTVADKFGLLRHRFELPDTKRAI